MKPPEGQEEKYNIIILSGWTEADVESRKQREEEEEAQEANQANRLQRRNARSSAHWIRSERTEERWSELEA